MVPQTLGTRDWRCSRIFTCPLSIRRAERARKREESDLWTKKGSASKAEPARIPSILGRIRRRPQDIVPFRVPDARDSQEVASRAQLRFDARAPAGSAIVVRRQETAAVVEERGMSVRLPGSLENDSRVLGQHEREQVDVACSL